METDEGDTPIDQGEDIAQNDLKNEIIEHVCADKNVFFKSQQIDDPELNIEDKYKITEEILNKSHSTFLSRFGPYIKLEHLKYFEEQRYDENEAYEVKFYLEKIRKSHSSRHRDVKNRRYAAMQQMIEENSYFSETEMMAREPLLYDQLVGQYLTEREKKKRDAASNKNDSFIGILMCGIEKDQASELKKQQEMQEEGDSENEEVEMDENNDEYSNFSRKQWGNFEDEEPDKNETIKKPPTFITGGERHLLKDEFMGIMYAKFISGQDESFDYSIIDESIEYDNLKILEQDEQDKYFDSEEAENNEDDENVKMEEPESGEAEDDLDVYMKHLNQHIKLQDMSTKFEDLNYSDESE